MTAAKPPKLTRVPADGFTSIQSVVPTAPGTPSMSDLYYQLAAGTKIQSYDIKLVLNTPGAAWSEVEEWEVGHDVPKSGVLYGRFTVPADYVAAEASESITDEMLVWLDEEQRWRLAEEVPGITGKVVDAARKEWISQRNTRLFVAKLVEGAVPATVEIPSRHRMLYPGERIRRGDKMIYDNRTEWMPVGQLETNGQTVPAPDIVNGHVRFCRPIPFNWQNWYVDPVKGKPEHLGGQGDPFPSVEFAQQTIEEAARKAGTAPYGIIWQGGVPKTIYDVKEPTEPDPAIVNPFGREAAGDLDGIPIETPQNQPETAQGDVLETIRTVPSHAASPVTAPAPQTGDNPRISQGDRASEPATPLKNAIRCGADPRFVLVGGDLAKRLECTFDELIVEATRQLPRKHRLLSGMEEVTQGDMIYRLTWDGDAGMWYPVPEALIGSVAGFGSNVFVLARKTVDSSPRDEQIRSLLARARQQYIEIGDTLTELAELVGKPQ